MKQIRFFIADDDLVSVLSEVERETSLQYVRAGSFAKPSSEVFRAGADLPGLGLATAESAVNSESFLVAEEATQIRSRPATLKNGTRSYFVDQLDNPDTVALTPAGRWQDEAVLYGTVGTASDSDASIKLLRSFERVIKRKFKKVKAFWVGPKAMLLLQKGMRLTIAVQSPKEFDLSLE